MIHNFIAVVKDLTKDLTRISTKDFFITDKFRKSFKFSFSDQFTF